MDFKSILDIAAAVATLLTALATVSLAYVTYTVATATREAARGADRQLQQAQKNSRGRRSAAL
jgi:uncharacterized membrane protein